MMKRLLIGFSLVVLLFSAACFSSTKITRVWSDAELVRKYNSVMVVGLFHSPNARKLTEDSFVDQLAGNGTKILKSYKIIGDITGKDRDEIVQKIKSSGVEAVLAIRLIELKDKKEYEPLTSYKIPYQYYSKLQSYLRETKLDKEETSDNVIYGIAVAEANFYDVATEKLVWTAVSDLHLQDSTSVIIQWFAKAIAKKLAGLGLI